MKFDGQVGMPDAGVSCRQCPLADCSGLSAPSADKRSIIERYKSGERSFDRHEQILAQGIHSPSIFTVISGVLIRYRQMADGSRQIINFLFPGDLIGLQGAMDEPMTHAVEALEPSRLCVFPRDRFKALFSEMPNLAYDIVWLAAKEEAALEDHLVALGRRRAQERLAYLVLFLFDRAHASCTIDNESKLELTITQSQVADMLGLSLVHTNRSLQALRKAGLLRWTLDLIEVLDMKGLRALVEDVSLGGRERPFI